jgi:hypothetical protein
VLGIAKQVELCRMNKLLSLLLAFFLSAVVHEYIICFSMVLQYYFSRL